MTMQKYELADALEMFAKPFPVFSLSKKRRILFYLMNRVISHSSLR